MHSYHGLWGRTGYSKVLSGAQRPAAGRRPPSIRLAVGPFSLSSKVPAASRPTPRGRLRLGWGCAGRLAAPTGCGRNRKTLKSMKQFSLPLSWNLPPVWIARTCVSSLLAQGPAPLLLLLLLQVTGRGPERPAGPRRWKAALWVVQGVGLPRINPPLPPLPWKCKASGGKSEICEFWASGI